MNWLVFWGVKENIGRKNVPEGSEKVQTMSDEKAIYKVSNNENILMKVYFVLLIIIKLLNPY